MERTNIIYYSKRNVTQAAERILDRSLKIAAIQDWVNRRYRREGYTMVATRFLEDLYHSHDKFKFHLCEDLGNIDTVLDEYRINDIKKSDIVLDIGANIGAFSILASERAKHVFAVEPLSADIIRKNIALNEIDNITVLETGLGIGKQTVRYKRRQKDTELTPLDKILEMTGKCDFLKIDCEGGEWAIDYHDLESFRQIECELHNFDGKHSFASFGKMLENAGFECEFEMDNNEIKFCLVHAKK